MNISLRDYIATKAMAALMLDEECYMEEVAWMAYEMADTMLAERDKGIHTALSKPEISFKDMN